MAASAWKPVADTSAWKPVKEEPPALPIGEQPASLGGVLETMGSQAGRGISAAADWLNPLNLLNLLSYEGTVGASARSLDAAGEARRQGNYGEAGLHALGALPIVGPPSEQILRDISQGNIPELLGHAAAAYAMKKIPEVAPRVAPVAKGAATGAWKGATAPSTFNVKGIPVDIPVPASVSAGGLGYEIGSHFPFVSPEVGGPLGGVIGASVPAIKGAVRGAKEAMKPKPVPPVAPEIMPMPLQLGPSIHNLPGVPDTSGPTPFTPPASWSNPPAGRPPAPTPSGPIPPVEPEVVTGLHLPEVPRHYAGEPNPTAAFKNDQAIVAELRKVPGITQDSLTADMVHEVRKALGQRRLKDADIERRVGHIRMMLPK